MTRVLGDRWLLPALDDHNRAWFTSGVLQVQACTDCGSFQHPPEDVCTACQSSHLELRESSGLGRIESVVVVHHPVHPALADVVPYALVVVSIDDAPGVDVVGNVRGRAPKDVAIGQRTRVTFEEVADPDTGEQLRIPQWEIVETGSRQEG